MIEITNFKERKLLKRIKRLTHNQQIDLLLSDLNVSKNDYYLKKLLTHGLISNRQTDLRGANPKAIILSEEGIHYFEWRLDQSIQFVKEKIITPVFVAFSTTVLMWIIGWLTGLLH